MAFILEACLDKGDIQFTRFKRDRSTEVVPLKVVLEQHFHEFDAWRYHQEHRSKSVTGLRKGKPMHALMTSIIKGYLDNDDVYAAVDQLLAPNLSDFLPSIDILVKLINVIKDGEDPFKSSYAFDYLARLFESQSCEWLVLDIISSLNTTGVDNGWSIMMGLGRENPESALMIFKLLFLLFQQDALKNYPDMSSVHFCTFAQLETLDSGRSRRGGDTFGSFIMEAFAQDDVKDLQLVAHDYLDLAMYCLELMSAKHCEAFLMDFYEGSFLKNSSPASQASFFRSSKGSFGDQQLALLLLQRKFSIGNGPSFKCHSLKAQIETLPTLLKSSKQKTSPDLASGSFLLSAHYCLLRTLLSPQISSFPLGEEQRIPWITVECLEWVRAKVAPLMTKAALTKCSSYLLPYRILLSKNNLEVVVISSTEVSAGEDDKDIVGLE